VIEQLALVDVPAVPKLTPRQQRGYDAIQAAGWDGLTSDEVGARVHEHQDDDRCIYCGTAGAEVGRSLRAKKLAQQRRRKAIGGDLYMVWTIAGDLKKPAATPPLYNEFPEGY
jgi:hypothetical protein